MHSLLQLFLILLAFLGTLAVSIITIAFGVMYGPIAWTLYGGYLLSIILFAALYLKIRDRPPNTSGEGFKPSKITVEEVFPERKSE
jgi:hypothetical protein